MKLSEVSQTTQKPRLKLSQVTSQNALPQPSNSVERPVNPLELAGKVLKGGLERTVKAGPASFNTITGGPATEFIHGLKTQSGVMAGMPEVVAESLSGATDPQNVLLPLQRQIGAVPGALDRLKAMRLSAKGRATVSRLLPAINIAEDVKANRPSGAQVEGFNIIEKTKNPMDIVNKFRTEKKKVIANVDELVEQNNRPINGEQIRRRVDEILSKQFANSSDEEKAALQRAINEELDKLPSDTKSANIRKRFLYEKTQNLQKAQRQGKTIVTKPEQALVDDAFSQAYKEFIEESSPEIKSSNQRFSGLDTGETAASKLVEGEIEQTPIGERVASQAVGRPSVASSIAALVRELPIIGSSPRRLTGIIEKLRGKYGKALSASRQAQAERLIGKEFFEPAPKAPSKPFLPYEEPYAGLGQKSSGAYQKTPLGDNPQLPYADEGTIRQILRELLKKKRK